VDISEDVFAAGLALLVIGIVLGFLAPPFGFIVSIVGLVLLVMVFLAGRRATERTREP
jgi:uncharacterized membrane protein